MTEIFILLSEVRLGVIPSLKKCLLKLLEPKPKISGKSEDTDKTPNLKSKGFIKNFIIILFLFFRKKYFEQEEIFLTAAMPQHA